MAPRISPRRALQRNQYPYSADFAAFHGAIYYNYMSPRDAWHAFEHRARHFFAGNPAGKLLRHNAFSGQGWEA